MALSKQDIEYIAHLARLEISADEIPDYEAKLSKIIEFIDELPKSAVGKVLRRKLKEMEMAKRDSQ